LPVSNTDTLCDEEDEMIQHLLVSYVVARQVYFNLLSPLNLGEYVPEQQEQNFAHWWRKVLKMVKKKYKKGVNSLIILGAWVLWKHRNACVFDGVAPSVITIMRILKEEHTLWCLAGARKLQGLGLVGVM
jgi:hypothetical protein